MSGTFMRVVLFATITHSFPPDARLSVHVELIVNMLRLNGKTWCINDTDPLDTSFHQQHFQFFQLHAELLTMGLRRVEPAVDKC